MNGSHASGTIRPGWPSLQWRHQIQYSAAPKYMGKPSHEEELVSLAVAAARNPVCDPLPHVLVMSKTCFDA